MRGILKAICVERRKAHGRQDALLAAAIAGIVLLWSARTGIRQEDMLAKGYSAFFYQLPVMNTVIFPAGMAALAGRLWDIEARGGMAPVLFTVQSRGQIFAGKAARGLYLVLIACAVEIAGMMLLGHLRGYTEALDRGQLLWLAASTFAVSAMLFFAFLALTARLGTPAPTLAVGLVASLSGLFAAFFPRWLGLCMPWGWYVPLGAMAMGWDRETRLTWFYAVPYDRQLLAVAVLAALLSAEAARRTMGRREGIL